MASVLKTASSRGPAGYQRMKLKVVVGMWGGGGGCPRRELWMSDQGKG